jgi:hypothetical protein
MRSIRRFRLPECAPSGGLKRRNTAHSGALYALRTFRRSLTAGAFACFKGGWGQRRGFGPEGWRTPNSALRAARSVAGGGGGGGVGCGAGSGASAKLSASVCPSTTRVTVLSRTQGGAQTEQGGVRRGPPASHRAAGWHIADWGWHISSSCRHTARSPR